MGKASLAVRMLVRYANKTEEVRKMVQNLEKVYQFNLKGEEPFYVTVHKGKLSFVKGRHEKPDLMLTADSNLFYRIATGEVDQEEAFVRKMYEVSGSITDAARLRRISQLTQESHSSRFRLVKLLAKII